MKKITNFLLALLLTIPAMAANTTSGSNVYFDGTGWTSNNYVQLMFGHSTWSSAYTMTRITNTNLYYLSTPKWDNHTEECVVGVNSKLTESSSGSISSKIGSVNQKTKIYGEYAFNSNQFYLIPNDGSDISWLGNSSTQYSSSFNFVQTISIEGSGSTQISTYKLNTKNSATASTGTTSATAAYTADVTCSATAADGYEFVGWYSGSTLLSTDASYTYSAPRSAKTIIAKFQSSAAETPVISNFAASATNVATGDVVTFSCDVENGDVANVVYLVNGEAIVGNEWTPTEAGEYTISATLDGALTQTLTVTVYVKPAIEAGEMAVFFDNTNSNWATPTVWAWGDFGNCSASWPGEAMTYLGNNMWKWSYGGAEMPTKVIFSNNGANQTENLDWVNGGVYSTASKTPYPVILPEGLNIQLTIPTTAYVGDEVTLTSVYTEGYTVKYYVNGVENGETWTPTAAGEYIVAANLMNGSDVVASDEKTVTVKEHTVFYAYLLKEGAWATTYIYYWGDAENTWPGTALSETETIDGNEYYKYAFNDVTTVNIIFNNNSGAQTSDIENVTATAYYRITNQAGGEGCYEASAKPFEDEIVETGVTYNVTVPAGTPACYIAGQWDTWGSFTEMTKVDETHYTITIAEATKAMNYKYSASASWDNVEMQADGVTDVQDRTWSETDVVATWKGIAVYYPENIVCEDNYYLRPGTAWNNDGAWFAAYFFNKNTDAHTWVKGELLEETGYYLFYLSQYNVPAAAPARAKAEEAPVYTHVIFTRMNPAYSVLDWDLTEVVDNGGGSTSTNVLEDRVWNQTADLAYDGGVARTYQITTADGEGNWISLPTGLEAVESDGMVYAGNVVAAEGAIEVYNLSGAVVARGNNRVDLNGLAGGVYVVRCGNDVLKVVR